MKGIIFNLLRQVVEDDRGADAWDELLELSGVEGAYTSVGSYSDDEFSRLVALDASRQGQSVQDHIRWFGRQAVPLLAKAYPIFFDGHSSARSFVLTLNDVIHSEVRKIYPGAEVPEFDFTSNSSQNLALGYRSPRRLCSLAEGFLQGAAAWFGEKVDIHQPQCMLRGADHCLLECSFSAA